MNDEKFLFEEEIQPEEEIQVEEIQIEDEASVEEEIQSEEETSVEEEIQSEDELHPEENQPEEETQELEEQASEEEADEPETESENVADEENGETETEADAEAEDSSASPDSGEKPYHERYYLKYREGKRNTALDLDGTKAFLQAIGFDGGELKQAREEKDCAEKLRETDDNKNIRMRCSYCGAEISGVEFFRLPDGRLRCNTCSSTVIKSKAEVEALCQRVISNMDTFFGATIDVPVSISVTDERKLKKRIGVPLGTQDSQSILILGVAINKKKKYSIILENGAPRISLIATFAHELTHIWQYTHWDNNKNLKKCPKSKHLLIYEGMAKWAEIQYLYLIGETNVARREEYITRKRQDAYGKGFCLYEDRYPLSREAMNCEETPFTPNNYPFD